jgi:hypothetical protein
MKGQQAHVARNVAGSVWRCTSHPTAQHFKLDDPFANQRDGVPKVAIAP